MPYLLFTYYFPTFKQSKMTLTVWLQPGDRLVMPRRLFSSSELVGGGGQKQLLCLFAFFSDDHFLDLLKKARKKIKMNF